MEFMRQWLALFSSGDIRPLRNRCFAELTKAADRYMRSAAFLELMRLQLDVATQPMKLISQIRPR
jgi:hypothetical protein